MFKKIRDLRVGKKKKTTNPLHTEYTQGVRYRDEETGEGP